MKPKKWLWGFAALPLVCLPLVAQETAPPESPRQAAAPAPTADTPRAQDTPEPVSEDKPEPADEHISADNNISFPVDI